MILLTFLKSLKIVLINMVTTLMMSAKMATPTLFKIKIFWNKCYDALISVNNVTNKILCRDSNSTVDVVMWPKFGNSSISTRKVIISSISSQIHQKNHSFEGWYWFKLNNLGLAIGTNLKFYTSMTKELKLKLRKFWGVNPTFLEDTGE